MDRLYTRFKELHTAKERRENRRIGYRAVAAEAGVSLSTVQMWMSGNVTRFDAETVIALCRYLDCSAGDLIQVNIEPKTKVS